jgi:hypothetical protein
MAIKATINTTSINSISIDTQKRKTVRTVSLTAAAPSLGSLDGIDISGATENEVLVYDDESGNFVAKELPILNGGTF